MTIFWIPSHVGVRHNEGTDRLARRGADKDTVDLTRPLTPRQFRTNIRIKQVDESARVMGRTHQHTATFQHYSKVSPLTDSTSGRSSRMWGDTFCTRPRLGHKYSGGSEWRGRTAMCTSACARNQIPHQHHYTLECRSLDVYRKTSIWSVTDQILWMFSNGELDEVVQTHMSDECCEATISVPLCCA